MKETIIHGFKVRYEEESHAGIIYFRDDLDRNEAKVFFEQAKRKKSVNFEDHQDRNFTLSYNKDNSFYISRR